MLKKIASSRKSQLFCYYFSPEGLLLADAVVISKIK